MRNVLLIVSLLCFMFGAEFLLVDKIVLSEGIFTSAADPDDIESDAAQRQIDLPDSGGYVLIAIGAMCLTYFVALRRHRERN